jgi:outer membrane protein assembly factor BamA
VGAGYRLKFFKYYDLEAGAALGQGRFGLNFTNPYVLSTLSQQLIWNTRNHAFFPERGQYIVVELKEAGGPVGGGFNYLHPDVDLRWFLPIRKVLGYRPRITTAIRLAGGVMLPYRTVLNADGRDDIPFAERRVLGGSNTVRGWVRNHLGPYSCDEEAYVGDLDLGNTVDALACAGMMGREQVTTAITPIGGTTYLNGTLEFRKYFLNDMGIAFFNDWGMVWNELSDLRITQLVPSAGMGLRYKSPIGAIRLDGAYRFDTEPMFSLEPAFQVHFGLSEAF